MLLHRIAWAAWATWLMVPRWEGNVRNWLTRTKHWASVSSFSRMVPREGMKPLSLEKGGRLRTTSMLNWFKWEFHGSPWPHEITRMKKMSRHQPWNYSIKAAYGSREQLRAFICEYPFISELIFPSALNSCWVQHLLICYWAGIILTMMCGKAVDVVIWMMFCS